jgi:short-subunit dehydrogenase
MDLSNLPIAITGASSGIGAATAIACAAAGMPVVLAARRLDKLEHVATIVRSSGGRAHVVAYDASRREDADMLVAETVRAFGSLYAVFANAGYGAEREVLEMSEADIRAMFETNFWGSLWLAKAAAAHLLAGAAPREGRKGHILLCSSCLSKIGIPRYSAYCASKAMQDHFARAMRHELRDRSVFVSSVHPIGTRTEFFGKVKETGGELIAKTPDRLMQPPERVAHAIVKCLRSPKGEVWTSWTTRYALGAATIAPGIADWALTRMVKARTKRQARA